MYTIKRIDITTIGKEVHIEEFPNAQPVFPLDTPDENIPQLVEEWAPWQIEVDEINAGTASEEVKNKHKSKTVDMHKIKDKQAKEFTTDRIIALSPYIYTINQMIEFYNFTQLKELINGLITAGIATTSDYNKLNTILKEQGVDLDEY